MPEEEAFCVFVRLMQEYRLRELFKPSMAELGLCIYQFEYLLQVKRKQRFAVWILSTEWQQNLLLISPVHHFLLRHGFLNSLELFEVLKRRTFVTTGATSRAQRPFPVPEFPHIHVCFILVPHSFPHIPPFACCYPHLWYFHVWGRKHFERVIYVSGDDCVCFTYWSYEPHVMCL